MSSPFTGCGNYLQTVDTSTRKIFFLGLSCPFSGASQHLFDKKNKYFASLMAVPATSLLWSQASDLWLYTLHTCIISGSTQLHWLPSWLLGVVLLTPWEEISSISGAEPWALVSSHTKMGQSVCWLLAQCVPRDGGCIPPYTSLQASGPWPGVTHPEGNWKSNFLYIKHASQSPSICMGEIPV